MPEEVVVNYPEIPWGEMVSMRNKVVHEYFGIDEEILWQTVKKDLPQIKPLIEKVKNKLKS